VVHAPTGRRLRYGELAERAARLPVPSVTLKEKDFRVVGQSVPRVDAAPKVDGSAIFGLDVRVPGALVAVVLRCPVPGGTVKSFDGSAAQALPGVRHVVRIPSGIAVVAKTYWHARQASQAVRVEWDEGPLAGFSTDALLETHRRLLREGKGVRVRDTGQVDAAFARAGRLLEAEYSAPFLAHATLEPQNATAHVTASRCDVWAPTQSPGMAKEQVRRVLGFSDEDIHIHQTWLGGGFGRRVSQDYVLEAVHLSRAISQPVQVVWSREDDMRHSPYRPAATHRVQGALDEAGRVVGWRHAVVSQSLIAQVGRDAMGAFLPGAPEFVKNAGASVLVGAMGPRDRTAFEGLDSLPYEIPHVAVDFIRHDSGVPGMFWRSVGHSHTAFAKECFIDELAHAAGEDPVAFRRKLLTYQHRHRWVLELAAEKAGWGTPTPPGLFRGVAVHESFGSWCAAVAEVSVEGSHLRVHRVVMAVDCGRVINPNLVQAQLEGAAIFGLSAALAQRITLREGRVQQSNFHDYPLLRMNESPRIETYIRFNEAPPRGVGEPGVPVIAPAVANAVFAATGRRLRQLPLSLE
jgi:isoquinoline 1-oxidoreductase subunit beta